MTDTPTMSDAALSIAPIEDADVESVVALWQACGLTRPWNDPASDIALARRRPNSTVLIGCDGEAIVATAMVGYDGDGGWVYYVAVAPDCRARGFGRMIMNAAEHWLRAAGVFTLQLMVWPENAGVQSFYESIGYGEQKRNIYAKWLDGREATPVA